MNVTLPLTGVAAIAVAGIDTVVVTSASGEMAVVDADVSGWALVPWLVDVSIALVMVTAPPGGAVKATPSVMLAPAPRLAGMPVKVTAPVAGS